MATLVWLEIKEQIPLKRSVTAHLTQDDPRNFDPNRVVIAKGNVIEGIEAKW